MLYREAGVDIDAMDAVKQTIRKLVRSTYGPEVLSEIGLFGSLFKVPATKNLVLVASCDSVGTKVLLARQLGRLQNLGADIVNHSVNDILTLGAQPLFFLDYIGHGNLSASALAQLVSGLARACRANGCALVGGEIAMMPDIYRPGDLDLAGFIVGAVRRDRILEHRRLAPGDIAIGLPSNGLHTNGYTLARKLLFEVARLKPESKPDGFKTGLGDILLRPHRSYLRTVYPVLPRLKAIAHITGGGFEGNINRLLPGSLSCVIRSWAWRPPAIFRLIQQLGDVPKSEMYRTFNMGIGMVLFAAPDQVRHILGRIPGSRVIGVVTRGTYGTLVI